MSFPPGSYIHEKMFVHYFFVALTISHLLLEFLMLLIFESKPLIFCCDLALYEFKQMCDYSIFTSMLCTIQNKVQL